MIENLMDNAENEIHKELAEGESLTPRYSPGYGNFPLDAQRAILDLLDTPRKIGVSLTGTMLMVPSKSVSAVIGVTPSLTPNLF
jgi:cobalamin-dependent methionine synthase I